MEIIDSIILGIVQGLTEFLPISSSGHLILTRELLGSVSLNALAFDAVLQLATTLAVLVYFRKDIFGYIKTFFRIVQKKTVEQKEKIMLYAVILGTLPAIILGLLLEDLMESTFRNPILVSGTLIAGALVMFFADKFSTQNENLTTKKGFVIGFYQALALIPGMSRSGMTISGGLRMGLNREEATRFSFLLAFPILFGSGMKKLLDLNSSGLLETVGPALLVGSLVSFAVGLAAINFLIKYLKSHSMNVFVIYRIVLAVVILVLFV